MSGFQFEFVEVSPSIPSVNEEFKKYIGSEDEFQKSVANYLRIIDSDFIHVPNGGSRNKIEATKFKAMGVKPGVSDVLIFDQKQGYIGFVIELKTGRNTPTDYQLKFIETRKNQNWLTLISWSLDEVIFWVDWYYSIQKVKNYLQK